MSGWLDLTQQGLSPCKKRQASLGALTVAGSGGDVFDLHHVALGLTVIKGRFQGSYFEVGYGRSDFFQENRRRRFKIDGFLSWEFPGAKFMRPFAQMTVDADLGRSSDSIQTYLGFDFDLKCLFSKC